MTIFKELFADIPRGFKTLFLVWCATAMASVAGYILNFVKLIGALDGPITAILVARMVGVIAAPLGAILGFF